MVIRPRAVWPGVNGPSILTPNHLPNSAASVSAFQTRARGAFNVTRFSIRSVLDICATSWLHVIPQLPVDMQPYGCSSAVLQVLRPEQLVVGTDALTVDLFGGCAKAQQQILDERERDFTFAGVDGVGAGGA
jgi:hypothetical protein